jgi:hypothetical protein
LSRSALKVITKLPFEDEVYAFNFLLFAELLAIAGQRLAAAHRIAVLSRRLSSTLFNRAGRLVTAVALEEKFCTFTAAQTAHRISIPSQAFYASSLMLDGKVYRPQPFIL